MVYDPTRLKDYQIAELAERNLPGQAEWQERLGLQRDEVIPYGRICKLDFLKIMNRLKDRPNGKYINVTAITPTPWARVRPPQPWVWWKGWAKGASMPARQSASPPAVPP